MKLQSRSRDEPEINVISLVDVLLVLVLFLMVSTSFLRETEITMQLPEAAAEAPTAAPDDKLEIMITQAGAYVVNGRELVNSERRTLRAAIERLSGEKRDVPVFIRADAAATHQAVVTAMDVAGQLGFVKLNIATVTPPEAQSAVRPAARGGPPLGTGRKSRPCPKLSRAPPRPIGGCFAIYVRTVWIVVAAVVPAAIYALLGTLVPLLMSQWIDALKDVAPLSENREGLIAWLIQNRAWVIPLAIVVLFPLRGAMDFRHRVRVGVGGPIGDSRPAHRGVRALPGLPARYFDQGSSGVLISRLTYNTEQVAEAISTRSSSLLRDTIAILLPAGHDDQHESTADAADRRGRPRHRVGGRAP